MRHSTPATPPDHTDSGSNASEETDDEETSTAVVRVLEKNTIALPPQELVHQLRVLETLRLGATLVLLRWRSFFTEYRDWSSVVRSRKIKHPVAKRGFELTTTASVCNSARRPEIGQLRGEGDLPSTVSTSRRK